jgi:hypothetical protein
MVQGHDGRIVKSAMKRIILISNIVATSLFLWFVLFMGSDDASVGALGFLIFIIPFLFIMTLINVVLYVIFRVTRSKDKTRACPACARVVAVGITTCGGCGFDFMKASGGV